MGTLIHICFLTKSNMFGEENIKTNMKMIRTGSSNKIEAATRTWEPLSPHLCLKYVTCINCNCNENAALPPAAMLQAWDIFSRRSHEYIKCIHGWYHNENNITYISLEHFIVCKSLFTYNKCIHILTCCTASRN